VKTIQLTNEDHEYIKSLVDKKRAGYKTLTDVLQQIIKEHKESNK